MCNTLNAGIIDEVVTDFINLEKPFTAFDATQEGMRRGTTEQHGQLKGEVHAIMSGFDVGQYKRSMILTPSGKAWLYHPPGYDVQSYIDNMTDIVAVNSSTPADPVTPISGNTDVKQQSIDNEGRLPIYGDMLKDINCDPGTNVEVVQINDKLIIGLKRFKSDLPSYKVNQDGRIRVSAKVMNEFGPATFFNITLDKNLKQITVTL